MFFMEVFEPAQTECASPIVFAAKEGLHTSLFRRIPKSGRSDDMELLPDFADFTHGWMYALVGRRYDIFEFGRKQLIWEGQNRRAGSQEVTSYHGPFRLTWMPFGLKDGSGTSNSVMEVLPTKVKWHFDLDHLDNILLFQQTPDEHIQHVCQVLTLLNNADVTLNLKKCEFLTNCINYFGHVIRPQDVSRC